MSENHGLPGLQSWCGLRTMMLCVSQHRLPDLQLLRSSAAKHSTSRLHLTSLASSCCALSARTHLHGVRAGADVPL